MDKLFDNYEKEKKITAKIEAMAIKYEGDKIIVPNTILEKLLHPSPLAKMELIIAGIAALIGLLQLMLMLYGKLRFSFRESTFRSH